LSSISSSWNGKLSTSASQEVVVLNVAIFRERERERERELPYGTERERERERDPVEKELSCIHGCMRFLF